MRVLGIDPGAHVGWCVYDTNIGWVAGGAEEYVGFPTVATLAHEYGHWGCERVAIEEPFVRSGTGPAGWAVGECCKIFGYARGRLEALNIQVIPVAAGEWQKYLTGKSRGSKGMSKMVNAALAARHLLPKRSNQHARDACGVAMYVAENQSKGVTL